jgi:hypothetical protein
MAINPREQSTNRTLPCFTCGPTLQPCLYPWTVTIQELLDCLFGAGVFIWLLKAFQCAEIPTTSIFQWGDRESREMLLGFKGLCVHVYGIELLHYRDCRVFEGDSGMWGREERLLGSKKTRVLYLNLDSESVYSTVTLRGRIRESR